MDYAMACSPMFVSDNLAYESCSQFVHLIRYQIGDPNQVYGHVDFLDGAAFAFIESPRNFSSELQAPYAHTINFAWILLEPPYFPGENLSMSSPEMTIWECPRKWTFTFNIIPTGDGNYDLDVHLSCSDCMGVSIRVDMMMDLYKGQEKVGEDSVSRVKFDRYLTRHLVYTGARKVTGKEPVDEDVYGRAFTMKGVINLIKCCN